MYKVKGESFTVVEGPYSGKQYKRGEVYETVPPSETRRFEEIKIEQGINNPVDSLPTPENNTSAGEDIKPKSTKNRQYGK